ncbi:MAG: exosome complex RNA-binding protein Csl4 [Candidatus Micrarchaeales archaeon]
MESQEQLVMPGDKIALEEELVPADNTFVDNDGSIRAAIMGNVSIKDGKISVINQKHNIRNFKRGMPVIGTVSDDLRAVMFVKLDNVKVNGIEFRALKDGKIVASTGRRPGGDRSFQRERPKQEPKPCGVGDVILARIIYEDPEIFTLAMDDDESGVVYAECELCSKHLETIPSNFGTLSCPECKHRQQKKVSSLYAKPEEIRKLFIA